MFDRLIAAITGTSAAIALPETPLRGQAATLLGIARAAVASGDWRVDGAADPDAVLARLDQALASPGADALIAPLALDLVDATIAAATDGSWRADGDALQAVFDLSEVATPLVAANDDPSWPAAAV